MRSVAIIPARGGSVRLPGKNIRPFFGRPVIEYSIEQAQLSGLFDKVIVSTDSKEVYEVTRKLTGDVHWRDQDDGTKGTQEVAADVLRSEFGRGVAYAAVIYPVAPMLRAGHIVEAWSLMHKSGSRWVMGVNDFGQDAGQFYLGYRLGFIDRWPLLGVGHLAKYVVPLAVDVNTTQDFQALQNNWLQSGYQ